MGMKIGGVQLPNIGGWVNDRQKELKSWAKDPDKELNKTVNTAKTQLNNLKKKPEKKLSENNTPGAGKPAAKRTVVPTRTQAETQASKPAVQAPVAHPAAKPQTGVRAQVTSVRDQAAQKQRASMETLKAKVPVRKLAEQIRTDPVQGFANVGRVTFKKMEALGSVLEHSGIPGVNQIGAQMGTSADMVRGANSLAKGTPQFIKDSGDLITGRTKTRKAEVAAGVVSGAGKFGYSTLTAPLNMAVRILVPGYTHDITSSATNEFQQQLDSGYRKDVKSAGINPDSKGYEVSSTATQIVGNAILLGRGLGKVPKTGLSGASAAKLPGAGAVKLPGTAATKLPGANNITRFARKPAQPPAANNIVPLTRKLPSTPTGGPTGGGGVRAGGSGGSGIRAGGSGGGTARVGKPGAGSNGAPGTGVATLEAPQRVANPMGTSNARAGTTSMTTKAVRQPPVAAVLPTPPKMLKTGGSPDIVITRTVAPRTKTPAGKNQLNPPASTLPVALRAPDKATRPNGDPAPRFPTAPPSVDPITGPGRRGTGDKPAKPDSGITRSPEEQKKLDGWLTKQGDVHRKKLLQDVREGRVSREEALSGLSGKNRKDMADALYQMDRMRMGGTPRSSSGTGGNPGAAAVKEAWRKVAASGGVDVLPESTLRQLQGVTSQALKNSDLSPAERTELAKQLESANQAQGQYHKARQADKTNPPVNTTGWNLPMGGAVFGNPAGSNQPFDSAKRPSSNPAATAKPAITFTDPLTGQTVNTGANGRLSANNPLAPKDITGQVLPQTQPVQPSPNSPLTADQALAQRRMENEQARSGRMHPYQGPPLTDIPVHTTGTTVIIGPWSKPIPPGTMHIERVFGTPVLWNLERLRLVDPTVRGQLNVYRTFVHPLTGVQMAFKTDLTKGSMTGQLDQAAMDGLIAKAGLSAKVPLPKLVDEAPTNMLPRTLTDRVARRVMQGIAAAGVFIGKRPKLAAVLPVSIPTGPDTSTPAEWMMHFLSGSGKPKVLSQDQTNTLKDFYYANNETTAAGALNSKIKQEIVKGMTSGTIEQYTEHSPRSAPSTDGLKNTIGGYHPGTIFKGTWELKKDGRVEFKGTRHFVAMDRYNWEAKKFNGSTLTPIIPEIPGFALAVLPQKYIDAFKVNLDSVGRVPVGLATAPRDVLELQMHDAMLAHLQMVQGKAQPFWTVGISSPDKVETSWDPNLSP